MLRPRCHPQEEPVVDACGGRSAALLRMFVTPAVQAGACRCALLCSCVWLASPLPRCSPPDSSAPPSQRQPSST